MLAPLVGSCSGGSRASTPEVTVFAAASLRDVVSELGSSFEAAHEARLTFNFAGSNVLAQQLAAAPKADVFVSADERWIDFLEHEGRLVPGTRRAFLRNRLVVVGHMGTTTVLTNAADLETASYRHLALADPRGVPAGRYARAWLEGVKLEAGSLWDAVEMRVAPTADVRAALALVESDPQVIGIVYASDVLRSTRARVLFEPQPADQPTIVYGAALISSRAATDAPGEGPTPLAERFIAFLSGPEAQAVYADHGFSSQGFAPIEGR